MSSPYNPCEVCLAPGFGKHFGIDACRGCTAFFRRTVVNKKQYICSNDDTCDIENAEGMLCKKCRFEKCLKAGMKRESIQNNRDIYGSRNQNQKAVVPFPSKVKLITPTTILSSIKKHYSQLESVRTVVHNIEGRSMFLKLSPKPQAYKETYRLLLREFYLVSDWISNAFPLFNEIPIDQRDILLRNFYLHFYNLEAGYFACQHTRNDVWYLPNGNFINCGNLETFYYDPENQQPMTPADAAKLFGGTCKGCKRNVLLPMLRENVTQFEFLALAVLLLFDTGLEGQSQSCIDTCWTIRNMVQREMIHYYSSKKMEEYPLRLANILSIIPSVQKAAQQMQTDLELSHLFNAYSAEKIFFDNCIGKRI